MRTKTSEFNLEFVFRFQLFGNSRSRQLFSEQYFFVKNPLPIHPKQELTSLREEIGTSSMNEEGEVTIPKEIHDALKLRAGDKVVFIQEDNRIIVRKARAKNLSVMLENQEPWKLGSSEFQRRARKEWSPK